MMFIINKSYLNAQGQTSSSCAFTLSKAMLLFSRHIEHMIQSIL